ncbi:MAG: DivIVA domain-containing protein [Cyclobacteriaceae bacterium]
MKITPAEIRQKEFERNFRGYDKDEVNAFLQTMSQEWERILEENREMRYRLDASQKEVEKLREVESSLYKTLKTAEDTGANLVEQANKAAELKVRESELKGEEIINEAKGKAHQILEHAKSKAKNIIDEMEQRIHQLKQRQQEGENQYDDLIFQLENAAQKALQVAERASERRKSEQQSSTQEVSSVREEYYAYVSKQTSEFEQELNKTPITVPEDKTEEEKPSQLVADTPSMKEPEPEPQPEPESPPPPVEPHKTTRKSFFD